MSVYRVLARPGLGRSQRRALPFGLGQYSVDAGLIFCQAGTRGRVGLPLAMGLRIALDPFSPPTQQSLIFDIGVPRRLPDTPDEILELILRDSHPDPSLQGRLHPAVVPDPTHPMDELPEPGVLARPVVPRGRPTAPDGDLHFDKSLGGLVDSADPGDRTGIVAEGTRRVHHAVYQAHADPGPDAGLGAAGTSAAGVAAVMGLLAGVLLTLAYLGSMGFTAISGCRPAASGACSALAEGYPLRWLTAYRNEPVIFKGALLKDCAQWAVTSMSVLYLAWLWLTAPTGLSVRRSPHNRGSRSSVWLPAAADPDRGVG
jgi:hypothetical protein